jgi:hypothetical protein
VLEVLTKNARSTASFVLDGRVDTIQRNLIAAIQNSRRFRIVESRPERIVAKGRLNWVTWGERISIALQPEGPSSTRVAIRVDPVLPTTLFDWGQGRRDIREIWQAVR